MIFEKEILTINQNQIGLTSDFEEVLLLPKTDFPRLIFQDFMNQLKINKIPIGFQSHSSTLLELEPINFEQLDATAKFDLSNKNTLNLQDLLLYILLSELLSTSIGSEDIFVQYQNKNTLFFKSKIPFQNKEESSSNLFLTIKNAFNQKQLHNSKERFFIFLGEQYKDKLLIFLTYLETKHKFKVDKKEFIEASLGQNNLDKVDLFFTQNFT